VVAEAARARQAPQQQRGFVLLQMVLPPAQVAEPLGEVIRNLALPHILVVAVVVAAGLVAAVVAARGIHPPEDLAEI
jgi:hypothetical protein